MNKIGKMEENNNEVLELRMEGQEKPKKWGELSVKDLDEFRQAVLTRYETYISSDREKRKQIVSDMLKERGLDTKDEDSRKKVSNFISYITQRRGKGKNLTLIEKNKEKLMRVVVLEHYEEYINSDEEKKEYIVSNMLKECGLDSNSNNKQIALDFISYITQRREKDENPTLTTEDIGKLKQATLERFEEYINGDKTKAASIITEILIECGLDVDDADNRGRVARFINSIKRRRERGNNDEASVKHRDRLPDTKKEEIKDLIITEGWHTDYLKAEANGDRSKKSDIVKQVLDKLGIKDYGEKNRHMAQRLIVSTTFKPWIKGGEEEKALTNWLYDDINAAVWDKEITRQAREEIIDKFKKQFPANKHNDYDITDKINSIVNCIKRTTPKPAEMGRIKSVQQAISQVTENQIRFDKVTGNYNDLFPQSKKDPVVVNNIYKATFDEIQKKISSIVGLVKDFTKE